MEISPEARKLMKLHEDWYFLGETETHVNFSEWPGGGYHFIKKPPKDKEYERVDEV